MESANALDKETEPHRDDQFGWRVSRWRDRITESPAVTDTTLQNMSRKTFSHYRHCSDGPKRSHVRFCRARNVVYHGTSPRHSECMSSGLRPVIGRISTSPFFEWIRSSLRNPLPERSSIEQPQRAGQNWTKPRASHDNFQKLPNTVDRMYPLDSVHLVGNLESSQL